MNMHRFSKVVEGKIKSSTKLILLFSIARVIYSYQDSITHFYTFK